MAFFDKLGATLSSTGKDVAKKAKEIAEVASLNGQISVQEENVNKAFAEIGKMVYQQKAEWTSTELAEKCSSVDAAYEEIDRLKKEIMNIKGVRQCPQCKADVTAEAAFCPSCGAAIPVVEPEQPVEEENAQAEADTQAGEDAGEATAPAEEAPQAEAQTSTACPDCE